MCASVQQAWPRAAYLAVPCLLALRTVSFQLEQSDEPICPDPACPCLRASTLQKAGKDASSSGADGADGGKGGKKGAAHGKGHKGHGEEAAAKGTNGAGAAGAVARPAEGGEGAAAAGATAEGGEGATEVIAGRRRKGKGKEEKPANWFDLKVSPCGQA